MRKTYFSKKFLTSFTFLFFTLKNHNIHNRSFSHFLSIKNGKFNGTKCMVQHNLLYNLMLMEIHHFSANRIFMSQNHIFVLLNQPLSKK